MFDQPEALEAWKYLIDKKTIHQASPAEVQIKTISGDYPQPFAAGKIDIWPSGRVNSTGYANRYIENRFS